MPEYKNPKPIAVAMIHAYDKSTGRHGLLAIRRAGVKHFNGMLAFPSGYMEFGESWQNAVVRELREETGIVCDPSDVALHDVITSPTTGHLQVFGRLRRCFIDIASLVPTPEASEFVIVGPDGFDTEFTTHIEALKKYFDEVYVKG